MQHREIEKLLELKGWTTTKLAAELEVGEHAVYSWMKGLRKARGPAVVLMRMWLNEELNRDKKVAECSGV